MWHRASIVMRVASRSSWIVIAVLISGSALQANAQDRDIVILTPPIPEFPKEAAIAGVQGSCDVRFSVDADGNAFDMRAYCTQPIFCNEAKLAVSRARFLPKLVGGVPTVRKNIVYPLEFMLSEWSWLKFKFVPKSGYEPGPTEPCDEIAVS